MNLVKKYCPKKVVKRRSGINIGLQKVIFSGVRSFFLNKEEDVESTENASEDNFDNFYDDDALMIPNHICMPDIKDLLTQTTSFAVDLSEETDRLKAVSNVYITRFLFKMIFPL